MLFNKGDILVCIGNTNRTENGELSSGWQKGLIFKVEGITSSGTIFWPALNEHGVFASHLRLATKEEINHYNNGIRNIADITLSYSIY